MSRRYSLFPIQHRNLYDLYKKHCAAFWTVEEIDLANDYRDFSQLLNEDEKHFLCQVLSFFAGSDGIVMENISTRFLSDITIPEAQCFLSFQAAMESIHSEMYSLLLQTYVRETKELHRLLDAVSGIPGVRQKAEWAIRWMTDTTGSVAQRVFAFALVEGVFFSSSFCAIYWLKSRFPGKLQGLTTSNEFIARDEGLHVQFACQLFQILEPRPTPDVMIRMVRSAVDAEAAFVKESLPSKLLGMNSELMMQYVQSVADTILQMCGHDAPLYEASNPFQFMDMLSMQGKTNFFEKRVSEYQRAHQADFTFTTDVDF